MPGANESLSAGVGAASENQANDEPTVLVRKLGSADVPTFLERVLTRGGEHRFVVVERTSRGGMTEDETSTCLRDARIAAGLEHPNVAHTRAITVRSEEISITSDYVAGERLANLWRAPPGLSPAFPLEIALRILVDVATGLGALHKLRVAEGQDRVKFVHGEVTPENVLVGLDGVALLLRAARVRPQNTLPKNTAGTIAPEVLSGDAADQRADIFSLGALLWQALSGKPLFPKDDIDAMLASAKQGTVARALVARHAPWALPLADVAARAVAPMPEKRFPTASSMLTELRKIAGPKLATAKQVAEYVEAAAGNKIAARLADLQASAVIRKATSIPAPRSMPPPAIAFVDRQRDPSEPRTQVSAWTSPATEVLPPQAAPQAPSVPPTPAAPAALAALAAAVIVPSRRSPPPPAKPVATPREVPPERARAVERAPAAAKAVPANFTPAPAPSPMARAGRWVIGVWLAIALVTGWFVVRAIRNRQEIVTQGATVAPTSTMLGPASSSAADETANGKGDTALLAPSPVKSASSATSTPRPRPQGSSEPHKARTIKLRK